jgi:CelD/BcsL family acetyltransferase involved in cellulose biosynthesis
LIIQRGLEQEIIPAFIKKLRQQRGRWDVLNLSSMPSNSSNLAPLQAGGEPWQAEETFICPVINLPLAWETLFKSFGKSKRKHQRRYRRRLDEVFPDRWGWQMIKNPAELDHILDEMIRLHQAKWQSLGEPGGFATPDIITFHHTIAHRFLEKGWLWLYCLRIEEQLAAIEYAYQYRGRVYSLASGLNPDFTDFSPGQVLTEMMIRQAVEAGLQEYDFLRGDEPYKFEWNATARYDLTLRWMASARARLEQRTIEIGRLGWQQVKQTLPVQWRRQLSHSVKGADPDY